MIGPLPSLSIKGLMTGMTMPSPRDTRVADGSAAAADGATPRGAALWLRISEASRRTWPRA